MSGLTAIIIDDESLQRRVVKVALEAIECTVLGEAEDGETGLALVAQQNPDLVLLDIKMPGMDGLEVLQHLVADVPGVYVVMLTALEDEAVIETCMIHGAKDYLKKNMPVQDMVQRLQRHADRLTAD